MSAFTTLVDELLENAVDLISEVVGSPPTRHLSTRREARWNRRGSLALVLTGPKRGTWFDHEAGQGGGPLDFIRLRVSGGTRADAARWARHWLGWPEEGDGRPVEPPAAELERHARAGDLAAFRSNQRHGGRALPHPRPSNPAPGPLAGGVALRSNRARRRHSC